ncbi:MAG: glycosyltransferase family 2 protein [Planctomycetaceae bacterium]
MNSTPRITIGMPVYNAGEVLRQTLDCLLAQSERNFELIISDNASTDGVTQAIAEEYARRDPRIRLTRQAVNLGATGNFLWVAEQARGDYFLWAAHDDFWSNNYLEVLSRRLDDDPTAVLATPLTEITKTKATGDTKVSLVPIAPNADCWATLEVFSQRMACVWIYGMYRTAWLKRKSPELKNYPTHYGDLIWLFDLILSERVVGDERALFHYSHVLGKYRELTSRRKRELWGIVSYHLLRIACARLPASQRPQGLWHALKLIYRHHLRRGNPVGTSFRIAKLSALWLWSGLVQGIHSLSARPKQPASSPS